MAATRTMEAMPLAAFGTMEREESAAGGAELEGATAAALAAGYRHLDCAERYVHALPHVGRAIGQAGVPREELWVTSKLSGLPDGDYAAVEQRVAAMLSALGLESLDLLLAHWPGPADLDWSRPEAAAACDAAYLDAHLAEAWANMQRLRAQGLCKRIGVSNFYGAHLAALERVAPDDPPFADEVFIDVTHQEAALVEELARRGTRAMAYRPLAYLPNVELAAGMGSPVWASLTAQAEACGADVPQLVLAWLAQRGIVAVTQSRSEEHLRSNLAALGVRAPVGALDGDGDELVAICGGGDDYAAAFRASAESSGA